MMSDAHELAPQPAAAPSAPLLGGGLTIWTTLVFAAACGALVANLYYAQSLIGVIGPDLKLAPSIGGLIVTLTQLGYGAGLLLLVSLADLVENRRLVLLTSAGVVLGLIGAATSRSASVFLFSSFAIGFFSVGAQVLVPLATYMAPSRARGRILGNIMGGLLAGIMLARPLASFVASAFGWRAIFWLSAGVMLAIMGLLWRALPRRRPETAINYLDALASTVALLRASPVLRRRAVYQGALFASFNVFWTAAPLMLRDSFGLTQRGIALFALAGAGGALCAPIAGRLADRGWTKPGTAASMICSIVSFLLAGWAGAAALLPLLAFFAVTIDGATQTNHIISQRVIFGLRADARARINSAYMTAMFLFGAMGAVIGGFAYAKGGWWAAVFAGAGLGATALAYFMTEP